MPWSTIAGLLLKPFLWAAERAAFYLWGRTSARADTAEAGLKANTDREAADADIARADTGELDDRLRRFQRR